MGRPARRPLRAERCRPREAAASASARNNATAPAAPGTDRSAAAATAGGLSASTAATRTALSGRTRAVRRLVQGGEGGQVADVVAERRRRPERHRLLVVLRHQRAHDGALVHVERRPQLAFVPPFVDHEAAGLVLPGRERHHPVLLLGSAAPVQRDGQALGLDVDALGRRGRRLGHHVVDHGGPRVVGGPGSARSRP